jgi:hypothetical protein
VAILACVAAAAPAGHPAQTDGRGRILALDLEGEFVELTTDLRLHHPGWSGVSSLSAWSETTTVFGETPGARSWSGVIPVNASTCAYEMVARETNDLTRVDARLSGVTDVPLQAAHFHVGIPIRDFSGGTVAITGGDESLMARCPASPPVAEAHLLVGEGSGAVFVNATGHRTLRVGFDRPVRIAVQDERMWGADVYGLYVSLSGALSKGEAVTLGATFQVEGHVDRAPARLAVSTSGRRHAFEGFGGNYCFNLDSPVTDYTLRDLCSHWARIEMKLGAWAPDPIAADDASAWQGCATNDVEGSDLHRGMLIAQELTQRSVPLMISLWRLPEWLYAPAGGPVAAPRRVAEYRWDSLLGAIGSYLLHLKTRYSVEPVLFSFNESDAGVDVQFTAAEQTEMIRRVGSHFHRLGLRTQLAAGDTGSPRGQAVEFAAAPLRDRAARRYVGAISFHAWGGASPDEYAAWARLAREYRLPLLAAEIGYDSDWRSAPAWFNTPLYAMRELRLLQDLVARGHVTGGMYWELTGDYAPVQTAMVGTNGTPILEPTQRYANLRQFCNLTPSPAQTLTATSSCGQVVVTAFEGKVAGRRGYVVHIANLGPGREATLTGLPRSVTAARAVRSTERERCRELPDVPVRDGTVSLELPSRSLLTLVTRAP